MISLIKKFIFLLIGSILLTACTLHEPNFNGTNNEIDKALRDGIASNRATAATNKNNKELPQSLRNALMPEINLPDIDTEDAVENDNEQYFDIAVNNIPAKDFFMGLVKDTKHNITVSPDVSGNISLELKRVSVPQAMEAVRNLYGFEYENTSYGYQVFPRRLETRIFNVNYLNIDRTGQSLTSIGSGQITSTIQSTETPTGFNATQQSGFIPSGSIKTTSNSNFWDLLQQNLFTIVGSQEGRSVVVNQGAGSIIVKAYPDELRAVAKYLDGIQNIMQRQVIIEAKVLEVRLSAEFQAGIDWKVLGLQQTTKTLADPTKTNFTDVKPLGTFSLTAKAHDHGSAFNAAIKLISTQGNVNVLSSPRIATINNQKAVIKVGSDRFFVTNISSNTTASGASNPITSASITLTPFFSGISLDVTPQIDEDDSVTIHIHPIVSQVTTDLQTFKTAGLENESVPLAQSTVRETDSIIRAKNGQVVVIGGLMENRQESNQDSTPGLDRLPGVGGLFKNSDKSTSKFELIILLRPIVVNSNANWQKQLTETARRVKKMRNQRGRFNYDIVPIKRRKYN